MRGTWSSCPAVLPAEKLLKREAQPLGDLLGFVYSGASLQKPLAEALRAEVVDFALGALTVASAMARRGREGLAAIATRSRHFGHVGVVAGVELLGETEVELAPLAFLIPIVIVQIGTSSTEFGRSIRTPPTYYIRKWFGLNSPSWKNRGGVSCRERCGEAWSVGG